MIKRKSTLLSLVSLLFVIMLITMFMYLTFMMHFDSVSDDFSGLMINENSFDFNRPGRIDYGEIQNGYQQLTTELDAWASNNRAVLFFKPYDAAGIAAIDYAGWFEENFNVSFTGQTPKTAIVQVTNSYLDRFVEDGYLFPGVYDYKIVGEFGAKNIPTLQGNAFFYYPLSDVAEMSGMLFTNVNDQKALSELRQIMRKAKINAEFLTFNEQKLSLPEIVIKMYKDNFLSRSMLFTFLGLIFSAVFTLSMWYRENNRYLLVHHWFGATHAVLFSKLLLFFVVVSVFGTLLGYVLATTQLNLANRSAYIRVAIYGGIVNLLFIVIVHTICFISWQQKYRMGTGAY